MVALSSEAKAAASSMRAAWRPLEHPDPYYLAIEGGGRIQVPKQPLANLAWRRRLAVVDDPEHQASIREMCRRSFLFWCNAFCWTYKVQEIEQDGSQHAVMGAKGGATVPFITWPCQDEVAAEIIDAIRTGRDTMVDKSREMGATWLVLAIFHWLWQFHPDIHLLEMSRTERLVDEPDNPDTLFWKHDFMLKHQPAYLRPQVKRVRLKLVNESLGSTIIGESTTGDVGQGGRKAAAFIDEAARIRGLKKVMSALADTTSCRIPNSTPSGPSFFSMLRFGGKLKVSLLPWWDHPDKGRGRKLVWNKAEQKVQIVSPWYLKQVAKRVSKLEVAENLDMDHQGAGFVFFDGDVLNRQLSTYATLDPTYIGDLRWRKRGVHDVEEVDLEKGRLGRVSFVRQSGPAGAGRGSPWRLWCDLVKDRKGQLRPPQNRVYVIGADVATGVGSSNSVLSVYDRASRMKVAEYACGTVSPEEFARVAVRAGWWFGGGRYGCAFLGWEANGPGGAFGRAVIRLGYPWVYMRRKLDEKLPKASNKLGWWSDEQSKPDLLEAYRSALARDDFRNPSREALEEAMTYVWWETHMGIGPGWLQDEGQDAKRTHGDRVIADAVAWHISHYAPQTKPRKPVAPPGSAGERHERAMASEPAA